MPTTRLKPTQHRNPAASRKGAATKPSGPVGSVGPRAARSGVVTSVRLPEHVAEALDLHLRSTMIPRSAYVRHHLDVLVASQVSRPPLAPRYATKLSQTTTPVSIPASEFRAYKRAAKALGYPSLSSMVIAALEAALVPATAQGGAS